MKSKSDHAIRALELCILSCEDSTFIAKNESKINEFLKLLSSRQENFRDMIVILAVRESWGKTFLKCNEMMRVLKSNTLWSGLALDALGIEVSSSPSLSKRRPVPLYVFFIYSTQNSRITPRTHISDTTKRTLSKLHHLT